MVEYMFKICIVGNLGVGKTTLLSRFRITDKDDDYIHNIGTDFGQLSK